MPALRTRDTHPAPARSLEVTTSAPPPALAIISPTPRACAFTFPIAHNLADSPFSSPSNSPFEPDLRALALSARSSPNSSHHEQDCGPDALDFPLHELDLARLEGAKEPRVKQEAQPLPLSAFTRTLSPAALALPHASATSSSPAPPPTGPVRRKSSSSASPDERRPKKGDDDYVKRPENAFILFRRKCCEERALSSSSSLPAPSSSSANAASAPPSLAAGPSSADSASLAQPGKKQRQADLSKTISAQWKALSPGERAYWEELAREKKREHEAAHPGYVYRPQRAAKRSAPASSGGASTSPSKRKNSAPQQGQGGAQVEFVVPAPRSGRSASAPTPPPYQAIQIPNVYFGSPASSSSLSPPSSSFSPSDANAYSPTDSGAPSLMPMISRRGGGGGFDYMPSFTGAFEFEQGLQSSEFLRSMFGSSAVPSASTTSISPLAAIASMSPTNGVLSPASSTSGSGPSSPYTPASASFHPSAFSSPAPASAYTPGSTYPAADATSSGSDAFALDSSALGLDLDLQSVQHTQEDYTSYASAWAASSPWASSFSSSGMGMGGGVGLEMGDFDLARIPEIGFELGGCAFPASSFGADASYPGLDGEGNAYPEHDEYAGGEAEGMDFGMGEHDFGAGAYEGEEMRMGMDFGSGEQDGMGFDAMMEGRGF
ncbi:hypothetical protein FB451DRAFT_396326 [Mycena latifolia]|nr:hypothetical protein FB451DRAFT_396326 [Mycena latifolia]